MEEKRIKVLIAINGFLLGGAQNVIINVLERIDMARFEPSLVTLIRRSDDDSKYLYHAVPKGVPVYDLRFKSFWDLKAWGTLWSTLTKTRPDVVFANLFFTNTVMRLMKPFFGYRVITVEHNTYRDKPMLHQALDHLLSYITYRIVAVSKTVARFTAHQEKISLSKFIINYGGIDINAVEKEMKQTDPEHVRKELGLSPHEKVIVTVSRIVPQKNHKLLLNGFALFLRGHQDYRLLVIGGGSHLEKIERLAQELGLEKQVLFLGFQKTFYKYFTIADFFVSTSLIEGFGTTHAEALAGGLPLVSTKTAGPDEMIEEGVNGFFIPEYTKEAVAEGLLKMTTQDLSSMKRAARAKADTYSMENMIRIYEKLFVDAASST